MERLIGPTLAEPRRRLARGASVVRTANRLPFVLTLIAFGLFIPEELSFYLFGLRLTVIRLIFLLLAPVLLVKGVKKFSAGLYRFVPSDLFVIAAGFWLIYGPANIDGLLPALNHSGPTVLEFCVGYFVTRIMFCGSGAALSFANVLCRTIAVVALIGVLDPMTNHRFVHDLAAQLTAPMHDIDFLGGCVSLGLVAGHWTSGASDSLWLCLRHRHAYCNFDSGSEDGCLSASHVALERWLLCPRLRSKL